MERRSLEGSILAACCALVLLGASLLVNYENTRNLRQHADTVANSYEFLAGLNRVLSLLKDAETGQRGFSLTQRAEYLEPYLVAVNAIDVEFDRQTELATARPAQQSRIPDLRSRVTAKLQELAALVTLEQYGGNQAARAGADRARQAIDG